MLKAFLILPVSTFLFLFAIDPSLGQLQGPFGFQQHQQDDPQNPSDEQIILYLSKWKLKGVRPSKEAYTAVRYYGEHAVRLVNEFGNDALAALSNVSGTSAVALDLLIADLRKVPEIYPLLQLIARHPEADRIVQVLERHNSELVTSPLVEVLLKSPEEVVALGPLITMPQIIAIHQKAPALTFSERIGLWLESCGLPNGSNRDGQFQVEHQIIGCLSLSVVALLAVAARHLKPFQWRIKSAKTKESGEPPRIGYRATRPIPAFRMKL
jgi:hypothetical protein